MTYLEAAWLALNTPPHLRTTADVALVGATGALVLLLLLVAWGTLRYLRLRNQVSDLVIMTRRGQAKLVSTQQALFSLTESVTQIWNLVRPDVSPVSPEAPEAPEAPVEQSVRGPK